MHDFNMFRALCSDSISVRFAAWHVQDALGTTMQCVAVERPASGLPVMRRYPHTCEFDPAPWHTTSYTPQARPSRPSTRDIGV